MPSLESERFAAVTALDRIAVRRARQAWRLLRPGGELQTSFITAILPALLDALIAAQREAATAGSGYVDAFAAAAGAQATSRMRPDSLAGVASDGRLLADLLAQPMIQVFRNLAIGTAPRTALMIGEDQLERIVVTQIHDAARAAEAVAIAANTEIAGYIRTVEPGACGRCLILAGRFYRWSEGFLRHPKCRCDHRPVMRGNKADAPSPRELFDRMTPAGQARAFTNSGAEAIRLGADPARVVNARRGMSKTQSGRQAPTDVLGRRLITTTTGTTRAQRRAGQVRLMPESLIALASGDRAEAVRLLRLHGFIL